jgi:hypothetical protein
MSGLNAAIGLSGAHATLRAIDESSDVAFAYGVLAGLMETHGSNDVDGLLNALLLTNLLVQGSQGFSITHLGRRTSLLLEALNGADLRDVWRRLGQLDPMLRNYELIRNNLTDEFLNSFTTRPSFGRLYICSPWISFTRREEGLLAAAVQRAERRGLPEILVVTRPVNEGDRATVPPAGRYLQNLGATVFLNRGLHSKLYIREPDAGGGYLMAILGSQNLTRSTYLELGIKIHSDTTMINSLIAYFFDLTSQSDEVT